MKFKIWDKQRKEYRNPCLFAIDGEGNLLEYTMGVSQFLLAEEKRFVIEYFSIDKFSIVAQTELGNNDED